MYEIERKFLVKEKMLPKLTNPIIIKQGYLFDMELGVTRIRQWNNDYILTIKLRDSGIKQIEIEKLLTEDEFNILYDKCNTKLSKTRYKSGRWEIDFFDNSDMVLAEIELSSEDEVIELPDWIEREVTNDPKYYNNVIAANQFKSQKI